MRDDAINVFADGSSLSSPRSGGIGIRIVTFDDSGAEVVEDDFAPGYQNATNNQMELLACIKGIQAAARHPKLVTMSRICIFTDSRYVVDNLPNAKFVWPTQQWCTRNGPPVLNADLWKDLIREIRKAPRKVEIRWVKGHSKKHPHNKAADKLAKQSARTAVNPPLSVVNVRRKKTSRSVVLGSVEMHGQQMSVRIITSEYLAIQRISKYKYEVINEDSKDFGNVDIAYSREHLRVGRHYEVIVNADSSNPTIVQVLEELAR